MRFVLMAMSLCAFVFISSLSWAIKYHIPHVTGESAQWATSLQVDNHYSAASSFTVKLFRSGVLSASKTYTVQANSYMNVSLKALDPYAQTGHIECSSVCINFRILYEYLSGNGKAEFLLSPDTYTTLAFLFPNQASGMTWKGMAFYNPWSEAANVTIYALGGGKVLGQKTDIVFPNEKHVGTIQTWFPGLTYSQVERFVVKSSKDLSGLTITGDAANAKLLFAPATEAKGFTPPASTNPGGGGTTPGVVSGRWTGVMTSTYGNKYTVSLLFVGDPVKYSGFVKYPANFEIQGLPQGTFSVPMDFNIDEVASSSSTTGGNAFAVDSGYLSELFFEVIFYEKDFGKNKYTIFVNICNAPNRDIQTRKYDYGYVDISRVQ